MRATWSSVYLRDPWLHTAITTVAPKDGSRFLGFICGRWEEVEARRPSLFTVYMVPRYSWPLTSIRSFHMVEITHVSNALTHNGLSQGPFLLQDGSQAIKSLGLYGIRSHVQPQCCSKNNFTLLWDVYNSVGGTCIVSLIVFVLKVCVCVCPYSVFVWQSSAGRASGKSCHGFCFYDNNILKMFHHPIERHHPFLFLLLRVWHLFSFFLSP